MELHVQRGKPSEECTIGVLSIGTVEECRTLEDPVRNEKIPGRTAIPAGRYEIKLTFSKRFKKILPEVLSVPGFVGVRIHPGNFAKDTEGCILVGESDNGRQLFQSRNAFYRLMRHLTAAESRGERTWLTIEDFQELSS